MYQNTTLCLFWTLNLFLPHKITNFNVQIKKHGTGENLEKGQQVRMKYTLMLSNGQMVDEDLEITFQLGDGEVIDGTFCNPVITGYTF